MGGTFLGLIPQSPLACPSGGARRSPQASLRPPRLAACQRAPKTQSLTRGPEVGKECKFRFPQVFVAVLILWGREFCSDVSRNRSWSPLFLQRAVFCLIPSQNILAAAAVLPHLGHLLPQRSVLPFQEGGAHRDLVLLQPSCVTRAFRRHVVLLSPGPVFVILGGKQRGKTR